MHTYGHLHWVKSGDFWKKLTKSFHIRLSSRLDDDVEIDIKAATVAAMEEDN